MRGRAWTNDEVKFLKGNYGKISVEEISKKLNRTEKAVKSKYERELDKESIASSRVILQPRSAGDLPVPEKMKLDLISGKLYQIEIRYTDSYDSTVKGRKKTQMKLKYIDETENLYIFEHSYGKRECFSRYTPKDELTIKLA